jgi:hypothetical protein
VEDLIKGEDIPLRIPWFSVKRTKSALAGTDVGVVDVAVDHERDPAFRVQPTTHVVSPPPQNEEIRLLKELQRLLPFRPFREKFVRLCHGLPNKLPIWSIS